MAITQNPLIGRATGTFGGAVFSKLYDKNIVRSKPVLVSVSQSDASKTIRAKFSAMSGIILNMISFITAVFKPADMKMPAYSYVLGHALKNAISGTWESLTIDWTNLLPAPDKLGLAGKFTLDKTVTDDLTVEWTATELEDIVGVGNSFNMLFVDVTGEAIAGSILDVPLADETATLSYIGDHSGDTIKVYICPKKVAQFKAGSELSDAI